EAHESDHKQERGQGEKISGAFFSCYSHMNLLLLIISRLIQMKGGSFFQSEDPPFPAAKSLYASASVLCPAVLFFRVNLVNLCLGLRHSVSRRCFPGKYFLVSYLKGRSAFCPSGMYPGHCVLHIIGEKQGLRIVREPLLIVNIRPGRKSAHFFTEPGADVFAADPGQKLPAGLRI